MKKIYDLKHSLLLIIFILGAVPAHQCHAQDLDVPYVPTPYDVVESMLKVTNVGPGDYVIDLGSGDGRIVIAAAERGAVGHGIDLNPVRVSEANNNARKAGVEDRVVFLEGDLFEADISRATVITMYLLSSVNLKLRPVLLKELRPGTRIVSHSFSMGDWEADEHVRVDNRHVYYWVIPADVSGRWDWQSNGEKFSMNAKQEFQKVDLEIRAGNRSLVIQDPLLTGEKISFSVIDKSNGRHYVFHGIVDGKNITGTAQIHSGNKKTIEKWSATLSRR
jgi:SAM-dependent methyltransferase